MKVLIQRPQERFGFMNQVFDVKIKSLAEGSGYYILEDFEYLHEQPPSGIPILHKGFFDAHLHLIGLGQSLSHLLVKDLQSVDELWTKIIHYKSASQPKWIHAYGWDQSLLGASEEHLVNQFQQKMNFETPLFLQRICGHAALVNEAFKKMVKLPNLPTWLGDKELSTVYSRLPKSSDIEMLEAFKKAQKLLLEKGITTISDMSLGVKEVNILKKAAQMGELKIDIEGVYLDSEEFWKEFQGGPELIENNIVLGPLDRKAKFSLRYWKRYLDGSLGARTAWLVKPYSDSESYGQSLYSFKELVERSRAALRLGFGLSFHCIGDAALNQALDLGEKLSTEMNQALNGFNSFGMPLKKHRLEHCQVATKDQLIRLKEQGFWQLFVQPHHRVADQGFVESRLGKGRLFNAGYLAKSFLDFEIPIALSSDAPIDLFDPQSIIQSASEHPNVQERLNFDEALWWYTSGSRLAAGLEPGILKIGSTVYLSDWPR